MAAHTIRVVKSGGTEQFVWMVDEKNCISAARSIACLAMDAVGMDSVNDFKNRDRIIKAISTELAGFLNYVEANS